MSTTPKEFMLTLRVDGDMLATLDTLASRTHQTRAGLIRTLIYRAFEQSSATLPSLPSEVDCAAERILDALLAAIQRRQAQP